MWCALDGPVRRFVGNQSEYGCDRDLKQSGIPPTAHHRGHGFMLEQIMPQRLDRLQGKLQIVWVSTSLHCAAHFCVLRTAHVGFLGEVEHAVPTP